jgi:hypothetical protein
MATTPRWCQPALWPNVTGWNRDDDSIVNQF